MNGIKDNNYRRTCSSWTREQGNAVVMLTVSLVVFLLVAGMVIDYGLKYRTRQQLQKQADASALAGSQDLPNFALAKQNAMKFYAYGVSDTAPPAVSNAVCSTGVVANTTCYNVGGQTVSVSTPYIKTGSTIPKESLIHVTAAQNVNTIFARLVGIKSVRVTADATALIPNCYCNLGYPYASANPRTSVDFNESDVLRAYTTNYVGSGQAIKLWYNDEHALTLGIRQVIVDGVVSNFPISPLNSVPDVASPVQVGTTNTTGDYAALDDYERPEWPAMFISDVTSDTSNRDGDWQFGGTPIPPTAVFGTWKAAVKRVVTLGNGGKSVTLFPDDDPDKNDWDLGPGSDPPPPIKGGYKNEGYGAEIIWDVDDLLARGLIERGHIYRVQFMVHDGDQNKSGGDVGQGCAIIAVDESCAGGLIE
jgi:Flp pilus assembly protein TadG